MNILIVTQYFWPEEFRINDLAVGFQQQGHQVTVLTGIPNYPSGNFFAGYGYFKNRRQILEGVKILRVPLISRGDGSALRLVLNFLSFAFLSTVLAPFYCRGKFDAIFVFEPSPITVGLPAILLKWIKKAPILFWVLDLWPDSLAATRTITSPFILRWISRLVNFIYKRCDLILVQSQGFVAHVQQFGIAENRVKYFPSWAEDFYQPTRAEPSAVLPLPQGFRVMFAGNIGAAQDFGTILDAAELLKDDPEIHWIIVGDGRMSEWVRQQVVARALSGNVHLLGRYPVKVMPQFFAQADALLVSLVRAPIFALTIPGKIQSYLACGRPIIAMLDGEGARIVREAEAGITCPAEDAAALAEAVRVMRHQSLDMREAMGRKGRQYYEENFGRALLFDRLESWMRELSASSKIRRRAN